MSAIQYFTIQYQAKNRNVSSDFFDCNTSTMAANIEATSKDDAISKLKNEFPMLDIIIVSVSDSKTMTEDDFNK